MFWVFWSIFGKSPPPLLSPDLKQGGGFSLGYPLISTTVVSTISDRNLRLFQDFAGRPALTPRERPERISNDYECFPEPRNMFSRPGDSAKCFFGALAPRSGQPEPQTSRIPSRSGMGATREIH